MDSWIQTPISIYDLSKSVDIKSVTLQIKLLLDIQGFYLIIKQIKALYLEQIAKNGQNT